MEKTIILLQKNTYKEENMETFADYMLGEDDFIKIFKKASK